MLAAEPPGNRVYEVTVRASEVRASDAEGATMSTTQTIKVTVTNVEEPGTIDLTRVQPQTGVSLMASLTDPDGPTTDETVIADAWPVVGAKGEQASHRQRRSLDACLRDEQYRRIRAYSG